MTNYEYQLSELTRYNLKGTPYYSSIQEFENQYKDDIEHLTEALNWIECGDFGAKFTLKLQQVWLYVKDNNRVNAQKHVGQVLLKALWGDHFKFWSKLSKQFQTELNQVLHMWLDKPEKEFPIALCPGLRR